MRTYRYIGEDVRVYPDILIPGEGSLVANPGDERELDEAPGDNRWIEVAPPTALTPPLKLAQAKE